MVDQSLTEHYDSANQAATLASKLCEQTEISKIGQNLKATLVQLRFVPKGPGEPSVRRAAGHAVSATANACVRVRRGHLPDGIHAKRKGNWRWLAG